MAKAAQELEKFKQKLAEWEKLLKASTDPAAKKVGDEIGRLTYDWTRSFPGSLSPFLKEMDDFLYYNSDYLSSAETAGKKFSELGKVLGTLGYWYKSH